ncbi:MAG: Ig-like domain-containing protein [Candidatus Neomarinimicrobiota bacterium]
MFDITATNGITIICFDSNWDAGTFDCRIYYKAGTHVGSETTSGAWTLSGSATGITSNGDNVATHIPITLNLAIPAGSTYGFYITNTGGASEANMNYTNGTGVGNVLASDSKIQILEGTGKEYPFGDSFAPRKFNGTVYYNMADVTAPTFGSGYPKTENVGGTNFDLKAQINEGGKAYYVVLADGAVTPTSSEVKAGTGSSGATAVKSGSFALTANTEGSASITGLASETAYDVYVVAEDDETTPNLQSSPTKLDVTTADVTAPTISSFSPTDDATGVAVDVSPIITFSENVDAETENITIKKTSDNTAFETIDVTSTMVTGTGTTTITINPSGTFAGETEYYVLIDATSFDDPSGNSYAGISSTTDWNFTTADIAGPTLSISSSASSPTNTSPIPITVTFSESVTGFVASDVTIGNGTPSNFAGSGATYTFDVSPSADGTVTIDIAANVAQDAAGNGNTVATQFSITYDGTSPTVSLSSSVSSPTNTSPVPITVTFSENVTGFVASDVTIGNGTPSNFAGSGTTYTFDVSPSTDGTVTVDIAADVAQDAAGNGNTAATQLSIIYDGTAPANPQNLTISHGNGQVTLQWIPNTESDLHKYNIYRSTSSPAATLIDSIIGGSPPDTFYVDTGLDKGTTYYYRITALDNVGNESDFSNEVSATPNHPPESFDLVFPYNDTTIVITRYNSWVDTLYFAWDQANDADGDPVTYSPALTGDFLNFFLISGHMTTNLWKIPYHHVKYYMYEAGIEVAAGTWTIVASDGWATTEASGGPFTLTIDRSQVSIEESELIPETFALHENYPNPFNPVTSIRYELPEKSRIVITIHDILGKEIGTLVNTIQDAGYKSVIWDGTDEFGRTVGTGIYLYQMKAGDYTQTKKMLLLK